MSLSKPVQESNRLRQAANVKYFRSLINNFLQKLILATKARRHKGKKLCFFSTSCLRAFVARFFAAKLRKLFLTVICKEDKFFLSAGCCVLVPQADSII